MMTGKTPLSRVYRYTELCAQLECFGVQVRQDGRLGEMLQKFEEFSLLGPDASDWLRYYVNAACCSLIDDRHGNFPDSVRWKMVAALAYEEATRGESMRPGLWEYAASYARERSTRTRDDMNWFTYLQVADLMERFAVARRNQDVPV